MLDALEADDRKPGLIILDNLSTLRRGVDENSNSETQSLVDFLVNLRHKGYAVLVVHHTNKAGKQRGASIIEVPQDFIIELKKPEGGAAFHQGANFELSFSKIRGRAPESANFVAVLEEDADGKLALTVDHAAFEVSDDIMVLRVVAESQKIQIDTERKAANKIRRRSYGSDMVLADFPDQHHDRGNDAALWLYAVCAQGRCATTQAGRRLLCCLAFRLALRSGHSGLLDVSGAGHIPA